MSVLVQGKGRKYKITGAREHMFRRELAACIRRRHTKGTHSDSARDCLVTFREKGVRRRYGIYGRSVVMDERTGNAWQFYFGLLLLEWLQY
jgi:hypothetical protein